jgi:hypothetical protein
MYILHMRARTARFGNVPSAHAPPDSESAGVPGIRQPRQNLGYSARVSDELAAAGGDATREWVEFAFMRAVELPFLLRLARGSETTLTRPAAATDPRPGSDPAAAVIHARYPSAHRSALHLQLEAWDDGSYRLTYLRGEGPCGARTSRSIARMLALHFAGLVRAREDGVPVAVD